MADAAPRPLVADGLQNVLTGAGVRGRDKTASAAWGAPYVTPEQIENAYRGSWLVRRAHDVPPADMTKNWRTWDLKGADAEKIRDEEERLGVQQKHFEALRLARLRGGAAIVLGLPGDPAAPAPEKIGQGQLAYLWVATRDHLSLSDGLDWDLTSPTFGLPKFFTFSPPGGVQQKIHPSRVVIFPGLPVGNVRTVLADDLVWGLPLLESANDAFRDAAAVVQAGAAMAPEALVDVVHVHKLTERASTADGEAALTKRFALAKLLKSQHQVLLLDGGDGSEGSGEEWETRALDFGGVPEMVKAFLQLVAGAADMPYTKLVGAPPEGMDATGEHDERNYEAGIKARQETELRPRLKRLDPYLLGSAGVADRKASWSFAPLHETTPAEQAELDNLTADTFDILAKSGLVQHDALAKTAVSVLNERATFPGLADNVAASKAPLPAAQAAENATVVANARAVAPGVAAKPGGAAARTQRRSARDAASGAVPSDFTQTRTIVDADGETLVLRPVSLAELRDATARTLYVSRKLLNPQEFLNHWRAQGVEDLMSASDLHVTVIASLNEVDWMSLPADWASDQRGRLLVAPGGPRVVSQLGDYMALEFQSTDLTWRFERLVSAGVEPRWPEFKPHASFKHYPLGDPAAAEALKPYVGRLLFGPEIFETVL